MARARNIKPGFFRNADLVELPMEARLLFAGLWTLADRAGRLEDRPKQIKMEIFPADNVDCDALLTMLASTDMLVRYVVDGKRYLQISNFLAHQNPHRDEKPSTIPAQGSITAKTNEAPDKHSANTVQAPCKVDGNPVVIGLNPESGFLNPDPRSLIPDYLIPESSSYLSGEVSAISDDKKPANVAEWIKVFAEQHGVDVDHRSFHDRKKFWPLAAAWTNAGVTVGQMRDACSKAQAEAKETIAWLPSYVDRVLASMQSVKPSAVGVQMETFRERDARIGRERWEAMTGEIHPDSPPRQNKPAQPAARLVVVDAEPRLLERTK